MCVSAHCGRANTDQASRFQTVLDIHPDVVAVDHNRSRGPLALAVVCDLNTHKHFSLIMTDVIRFLSNSELDIWIPQPFHAEVPADWWDSEADKSLLIGVFKHGKRHTSHTGKLLPTWQPKHKCLMIISAHRKITYQHAHKHTIALYNTVSRKAVSHRGIPPTSAATS